MTIDADRQDDFESVFSGARSKIASFNGCQELRMLKAIDSTGVYTTVSTWTNQDALEQYRQSDLFKKTWSTVKPMFTARAVAYSYNELT